MDYKKTYNWLISRLPIYQRTGAAAYKADLGITVSLLESLQNPQNQFKAIHVAGTNGKGSVCHILASILQEAGYKTGLYTSPHLKDFRERIKINGEMIGEDEVVEFVEKNKIVFEELSPSFFEMTVAMAYDHFAKHKVDFAILETGMGGRLDSTNISNPILSVITNIGYDHMQFLGDTIEQIAAEKAGIIKERIPLVIGKKQKGAFEVFVEKTEEKLAPIIYADEHFELKEIHTTEKNCLVYDIWFDASLYIEKLISPLLGRYQNENIAAVLQSLEILKQSGQIKIEKENIRDGILHTIDNTSLLGRWQLLSTNPLTICDTGHNPDGIKAVVRQISETKFDHLHFVFGMVNDKNPESILYLLPNNATYYFCKPDIPRGMEVDVLKEHAFKAGLRGEVYNSVFNAYNSAKNNAGVNDLVFIGGSTFVVAEIV